jgi:hypothetical protein
MKRIIFTFVFIISTVTVATACSCYSNSHSKEFRKTKAIFVGKLISVGTEEIQKEGYSPLYTLTFDVEKEWKGVKTKKVKVFTNRQNMCSAFEFREGETYLLYVQKDSYVTSDCASSLELNSSMAQENIKDLNSFWFRIKSRLWIF